MSAKAGGGHPCYSSADVTPNAASLWIKNLTFHPKNLPNQQFLHASSYTRTNSLQTTCHNTVRLNDIDTVPTELTDLSNNCISITVTNYSPINCRNACTNHEVTSILGDETKNIRVSRLESRFRARPHAGHICTASVTAAQLDSNRAHLYSKCNCGTAKTFRKFHTCTGKLQFNKHRPSS